MMVSNHNTMTMNMIQWQFGTLPHFNQGMILQRLNCSSLSNSAAVKKLNSVSDVNARGSLSVGLSSSHFLKVPHVPLPLQLQEAGL